VTDPAVAVEVPALVEHLRASRWTYPLVNAGHVLGIGLVLGSVVPMDLRVLGWVRGPEVAATVRLLRPFAITGVALAAATGLLLFATQSEEYLASYWFRAKILVLALALGNAIAHLGSDPLPRHAAAVSLLTWPVVVVLGRMVGYG
jgi:hypothetical protein